MTVLGFWITVAAFVSALAATYNYYRNANKQRFVFYPGRVWVKISVASVFAASLILLIQFLQHDFTNGYVYGYSDRSLPLHFLLSSFYAGQEGSFLFWALCSAIIAIMLMRYTSTRKIEPQVMAVYMGMFAILLLLLVVKTPFEHLWHKYQGAPVGEMPPDGNGLNPLLQNFWMTIHPPVLFVGFAAMAVPFSFAVAALWRREYQEWVHSAFPWILFAVVSLGMGLMLGAYWAYGVLGWGGYWGWDPVENSSLVPWITGVALIHTLLAQRRSGRFVRTNFALAIISFFLVVYSTFLTRSGILGDSSVHSFTDPGATAYWMLVGYLLTILGVGFGFMILRNKEIRPATTENEFVNRETALAAGTIALLLSAAVILFGTSLPIVSNSTVEPSFYDQTNLPIAVAIGLLIGLSLFVQWGTDEWKAMLVRSLKSLGASVLTTGILWFFGVQEFAVVLFVFASAFAFFVNFEFLLRTIRSDARLLGGKLAHIGLAIMFFGIIATGKFSSEKHVSLELNSPQEVLGYTMTYTGHEPTPDGKFAFHVKAEKDGKTYNISPVMFDAGDQGLMRNPDIASFLTRDVYLSPVSLDQTDTHDHDNEIYNLTKGEPFSIGDVKATFVKFDMNSHATAAMSTGDPGGMTIGAVLELKNGSYSETIVPAVFYPTGGTPQFTPKQSKLINGDVSVVGMNVGEGGSKSVITVSVHRAHDHAPTNEAFVVEASIKPFIILVWLGTVVMTGGFFLAMFKRAKEA